MAKQRKTRTRRREKKGGPGSTRRKPCPYCRDKIAQVDYKDVGALRRFISERGKIRSRRITGACRRHQSQIARAVKRARELSLLPYTADQATTLRGGAPERPERPERRADER
jgi:small subunit ribosomal protein S18